MPISKFSKFLALFVTAFVMGCSARLPVAKAGSPVLPPPEARRYIVTENQAGIMLSREGQADSFDLRGDNFPCLLKYLRSIPFYIYGNQTSVGIWHAISRADAVVCGYSQNGWIGSYSKKDLIGFENPEYVMLYWRGDVEILIVRLSISKAIRIEMLQNGNVEVSSVIY